MTILAVFRSRAQTLGYLKALREIGVPAQTVNTPKEAGVGCGLSVKFDGGFLLRARIALKAHPYTSFAGFLKKQGDAYAFL